MPDIDAIRSFVEAAETLNFRRAAETLSISPAAFGQRIQRLEDAVGTALFERSTRSVRLTEAGLRALPMAKQMLLTFRDLKRRALDDALPPVELTVGTRYELGLSWVQPTLRDLAARAPSFQFHLRFQGSGPELLAAVLSRTIDVAICSTPVADRQLEAHPLHEERYVLVAAPGAVGPSRLRRLDDLAEAVLLDIDRTLPLYRYFRDANEAAEKLRFVDLRSLGTIAAIRQALLAGEGVAVLPEYFVREDLRSKRLRRLFPRRPLRADVFRLVFRRDDARQSTFAWMQKALSAVPLR